MLKRENTLFIIICDYVRRPKLENEWLKVDNAKSDVILVSAPAPSDGEPQFTNLAKKLV